MASNKHFEQLSRTLLDFAGVSLNGSKPWDIQVHNPQVYPQVIKHGSLGLGEAYMKGWWDCQRVDMFFERLIKAGIEKKLKFSPLLLLKLLLLKWINVQTKNRSLEVGRKHYDLGNDLYSSMLDQRMTYTCGYWEYADNLDQAQVHKLELTCQKLMLKPGMKILDIGCGFGSFLKYAAENYGIEGVGITISKEQQAYAKNNCRNFPIEIRFQDYRDIKGKFDRIVSLGMFEHVGSLNHRHYMEIARENLLEEGLFLLHTIGNNITLNTADRWISKYIFPNGTIPSIAQVGKAIENVFIMEDWHNFGADYDKTLMAWDANFRKNWDRLQGKYDQQFYRMWTYYLRSCAGVFRARDLQLWQLVLSPLGVPGSYRAPRFKEALQKSSVIPA